VVMCSSSSCTHCLDTCGCCCRKEGSSRSPTKEPGREVRATACVCVRACVRACA
jgi:hypothetical protein